MTTDARPAGTVEVVLAGSAQAALFDEPTRLLALTDAELCDLDALVMRDGGGMMAQVRRAAALVAWVHWHREPEGVHGEWLDGWAEFWGVDRQTIVRWRRKVVADEALAVPGVAELRSSARKTAGHSVGDITVSKNPDHPTRVSEDRAKATRAPAPQPVVPAPEPIPQGANEPLFPYLFSTPKSCARQRVDDLGLTLATREMRQAAQWMREYEAEFTRIIAGDTPAPKRRESAPVWKSGPKR